MYDLLLFIFLQTISLFSNQFKFLNFFFINSLKKGFSFLGCSQKTGAWFLGVSKEDTFCVSFLLILPLHDLHYCLYPTPLFRHPSIPCYIQGAPPPLPSSSSTLTHIHRHFSFLTRLFQHTHGDLKVFPA